MTERAAPFYCPYCGEEDLRPSEAGHGAWECGDCNRAFGLKFLGLLSRGFAAVAGGAGARAGSAERPRTAAPEPALDQPAAGRREDA